MPLPENWDEMTKRIIETFSEYGKVNGVGWTKVGGNNTFNPKGKDGILVNFETLFYEKKAKIPTVFEGWPVRWQRVGTIRAQGEA
jgi:hypothetical protein